MNLCFDYNDHMNRLKKPFVFVRDHKIIAGIVLVLILIVAFVLRPKPATPIPTQKITYQDLTETVSVSGTVAAKKQANLAFVSSGPLTYLGVAKGDHVTKGQIIAQVDSYTLQKEFQQALNTYRSTRDSWDQLQANQQNNTLNMQQQTTYNTSGATATTTQQNIYDIVKRVVDQNQATLDNSVINVEIANKAVQLASLVSPIDGIVTGPDTITQGMSVTPTTTFTIVDPNSLVFAMDVDEADVGKVATGQAALINLDAYPSENLTLPVTHIDFVSHVTSNGGNAFTTEVQIPTDEFGKYRIGMNGNGTITVNQRNHVLTVPLASLVDNQYVYLKKGQKFVKQAVTLGIQNDTDVEITQGLSYGDEIAVDPSKVTPAQLAK